MKMYCKRTDGGLMPVYPSDYDDFNKLKIGDYYMVEIKRPRNIRFHKKFMALVNMAWQNSEMDMPFNTYRRYLIAKAGFFNIYKTPKGEYIEPASISFSSMDNDEFEQVYSRVLNIVIRELGLTEEDVANELHRFF